MTIRSDFHVDFIASDAKAAGPGPFQHNWTVPGVRFCDMLMKKTKWRMTLKKLMIIAVLVAWASPSFAGSSVETWGCRYSRYYGYSNCTTRWTEIPDPVSNPEQERLDAIARQKEDEKWEAFCKPTFKADQYGVRRASYAKKGCEFGLSE
jgi:hypothetical protein